MSSPEEIIKYALEKRRLKLSPLDLFYYYSCSLLPVLGVLIPFFQAFSDWLDHRIPITLSDKRIQASIAFFVLFVVIFLYQRSGLKFHCY